jgi:hypothetical protein
MDTPACHFNLAPKSLCPILTGGLEKAPISCGLLLTFLIVLDIEGGENGIWGLVFVLLA